MLTFATKLTAEPWNMNRDDAEALRMAGLSDRAIHDLVNVVAYFAYSTRIVAGLGVVTGGREGELGQ
eukprot:m.312085 g.312085  ORF g.312085 m.312085 type:complete len:67 (+) comp16399_c0_seq2:530-730(+)